MLERSLKNMAFLELTLSNMIYHKLCFACYSRFEVFPKIKFQVSVSPKICRELFNGIKCIR